MDENLTVGSPTSHRFCTTVRDRCPVVDAVSVREGSIAGILIRLRNPRGSGGVGSKDPPSHPPLERSARCPPFREDVAFTEGVKGTGLGGLFSRRGPFSGARGFALARCNTETGYLVLNKCDRQPFFVPVFQPPQTRSVVDGRMKKILFDTPALGCLAAPFRALTNPCLFGFSVSKSPSCAWRFGFRAGHSTSVPGSAASAPAGVPQLSVVLHLRMHKQSSKTV